MQAEHSPSRRRLLNPTLVSWHWLGLALLLGIFLPLCRGCDDQVRYATNVFQPSAAAGEIGLVLFIYGHAFVIAASLLLIYLFASYRLFLAILAFELLVVLGTITYILFQSWPSGEAGQAVGPESVRWVLGVIPPAIGIPYWIGVPIYQKNWPHAWSRLQQLVTCIAWLVLNLLCLFAKTFLIGYWYTTLVMMAIAILAAATSRRMAHDLWDPAQRAEKLQFTTRQLFFWMTCLPLVAGYYAAIDPMVSWLFKG